MQLVQISQKHHVEGSENHALRDALRNAIEGEVRFGPGDRSVYARDASNYRQHPIGAILPRNAEDVVAALKVCREFDVAVLGRGGGTSLSGQCCNHAVVFDYSKYMNRILEINIEERWARVEPGVVLDDLREHLRPHRLTFGPDPSTHSRCTLGGMLGNNSCGVHALLSEFYGSGSRTEDNVLEMEVITYEGVRMRVGPTSPEAFHAILERGGTQAEIYARLQSLIEDHGERIRDGFPQIPRRVSGFNLPALLPEHGFDVAKALVGSEGTCVTFLEAKVSLCPALPHRQLLVVGYDSIFAAADDVPDVRRFRPVGCEALDDILMEDLRSKEMHSAQVSNFPGGSGWMFVEFGGDTAAEVEAEVQRARQWFEARRAVSGVRVISSPEEQERFWSVRESGLGATAFIPGRSDTWPGWEDAAVPVEAIGAYLREFRALLDRYGYRAALYGHLGQGCIHCRINFDLRSEEGLRRYRAFTLDAARLVVTHGGSLSGEHGDGQSRGELLPIMYGDEIVRLFETFKDLWDPRQRMNPGKVVRARSRTDDLALGPDFAPNDPKTSFAFPDDKGRFSHAARRCVGVGECRRKQGGVMCPSYKVTLDELHTTRGRARLLFDMLDARGVLEPTHDEAIHESLDLCLACKGCKSDCPVNVDMATYKAEFLREYYDRHRRPREAFALGLVDVWARLASHVPRLANFVSHASGLERLFKFAGNIHPQRSIPRFANQTFVAWFRRRKASPNAGGQPVLLWPDTFNNHFFPQTLQAATSVLESFGFAVRIPRVALCCGRPLYDFGFLDRAQRYWKRTMSALATEMDRGIPMVGLEPSCVAAFRDELVNMFPEDPAAQRLSRSMHTLAEFLMDRANPKLFPQLQASAIVQPHCHQHAVIGHAADKQALARMGVDVDWERTSGCCGMAGSFGFERSKYEVSLACGEQSILPAVRSAPADCLILADGFSCREQISHGASRRPLHLAELMMLAHRRASLPPGTPAESLLKRS